MHHLTSGPLAVILLLTLGVGHSPCAEVMIANESFSSSELTPPLVEDIYLGRVTTWPDGQKIVLVVLEDGETHTRFLQAYVRRTPSQFMAHWKKLLFTGKGKWPTITEESDAVEFVRKTKGAIAYISQSTPHDGVKVLAIR